MVSTTTRCYAIKDFKNPSFRLEDSRFRQERASKTLINVKAGVEHLADKLQHLKAVSDEIAYYV